MSAVLRSFGRGRVQTRYRSPMRCRARRNPSSGSVSRLRLACILRRVAGVVAQDAGSVFFTISVELPQDRPDKGCGVDSSRIGNRSAFDVCKAFCRQVGKANGLDDQNTPQAR